MKTIIKTTAILLCAAMMLGMAQCQKSTYEDETIILLGQENYVISLNDLIPDTLRTTFPSHFGGIPEGYIPPNIEGEYRIGNKQLCYANLVPIHDTMDVHIRITKQHNRVACIDLYEYGTVNTDTAYIMGSGPEFTLYFTEEKETEILGSLCQYKRIVIVAGEKTDQGIKNLRYGTVILESEESGNPYVSALSPGMYFIYRDDDDFSELSNWLSEQR